MPARAPPALAGPNSPSPAGRTHWLVLALALSVAGCTAVGTDMSKRGQEKNDDKKKTASRIRWSPISPPATSAAVTTMRVTPTSMSSRRSTAAFLRRAPGWTRLNDTPGVPEQMYVRTSNGGTSWRSPDVRLSDLASGAPYKSANGYAFPYGDYHELSVDSGGRNHVVWGEGTSYTGPGGTWYTRGQ